MTHRRPFTFVATLVVTACIALVVGQSPAYAADLTPPSVPQGLQVTGTTEESVSLAWNASSDRSGQVTYRVYVDGARRGATSQTAHTQTGLARDTRYTFVVRAVDRYGNVSQPSSPLTATTAAGSGGGAPTAPTDLQVTQVTYDTVALAWQPSSGSVAYYLIHRDGLWVNSSYGTTGSVGYLAAGSTHTIEVRARGLDNSLSEPATVVVTTQSDTGPPTTPTNLHVVTDGGTPFGLAWDTSTDDRGVGSYQLFADGSTAFGGGPGVSFYSLTDEYCTVARGQTYTFTVRAVDLSGNVSAAGTSLTVTVP